MNQIRRMTAASTAAKSIKPTSYELLDFLSVPHDELARVFPANPKEDPNA